MDFLQHLKNETSEYQGDFERIIRLTPAIFSLLNSLSLNTEIPKEKVIEIYAAMGYFVAPLDLYSEELFGAIGYVDDIILSIRVIKHIEAITEIEPIVDCWEGDFEDLQYILAEGYDSLRRAYPKLSFDIDRIFRP
jgi:uncharacterized membrane protein YkvA (DUF1232 family)